MKTPHLQRLASPALRKFAGIIAVSGFVAVCGYGLYYQKVHAVSPILVGAPTANTTCSTRMSSEDVWPGYFYGISPPSGGPTLTQRINNVGLDYWRVQAVPGYNDASTSLPSPQAYTTDQGHPVPAWSFATLDKVLSDGPAGVPRLLDLTQPPDVLWTGTSGGQGTLSDQTYNALAQYYANVVKYFRTGILVTNSGSTVSYTSTTLTDTAKNFSAYNNGTYAVTATTADSNGFPDWETATITAVSPDGHTATLSWPSGAPAAGAAYNLASLTPPITAPANATPWPRPPSVGAVSYYELFNEPDLSNSNFPRTSPALSAPTPTLTGIHTANGTLTPGTTYAYRLTAVNIGEAESLPGTEQTLTLPAGDNAITVSWSATSNLGLSPFAYRIYGRTSGGEHAMVVVGSQASSGLNWTDTGTVSPSGNLPTSDGTPGYQLWRGREYTRMWNVVAPAIKAIDATVQLIGPTISNPQSLSVGSTVTTAITTGPSDNSWRDSTDFIPYLMAHGSPKPDVVSFHSYGNYQGSVSTDASYFAGLQSGIDDYLSVDDASLGSTNAWITEANIDAGFLDNNDYRAMTQLGSAWLADDFVQWCSQAPKVQQLFQFEVANTNTWALFAGSDAPNNCYPQPACLNIKASQPNLEYWLIYWLSRYFPAGSKVAPVSNVPAGYVAYAVQPPGGTTTSVIVINTQVGTNPGQGVSGSVTVQLSGLTSSDTKQVMIDGNTSISSGPTLTDLGAQNTVNVSLNGYGVGILNFTTSGGGGGSAIISGSAKYSPQASQPNTVKALTKVTQNDNTNEAFWSKSTDVFDTWWRGGTGLHHGSVINISQGDIVGFDSELLSNQQHNIYTATAHNVWKTSWAPGQTPGSSQILQNLGNIRAVQKTFGPDGTTNELYVLTDTGVQEYWWPAGSTTVRGGNLYSLANPVAMTKTLEPDGTQVLYIADQNYAYMVRWGGSLSGLQITPVAHIAGITSLAFSEDSDGKHRLYIGTNNGSVWEANWYTGGSFGFWYVTGGAPVVALQKWESDTTQVLYEATDGGVFEYSWPITSNTLSARTIVGGIGNVRTFTRTTDPGNVQAVYTATGTNILESWWLGNNTPSTGLVE